MSLMNLETLPDDPASLKEIILLREKQFQKEITEKKNEIVRQKNQIIELQKIILIKNDIIAARELKLFGRKSEKWSKKDVNQARLFDEPESPPPEKEEVEETVKVKSYTRKRTGRKSLPSDLPRKEIIHDIPESEKHCACGHELTRIGEESSERLGWIPAKVYVERHIRPKYACKNCEGSGDEAKPAVRIAPVSPQLIPKSIASESLLASVITSKFVDGLPFYRQEKIFQRIGVDITRANMCHWAIKISLKLRRLYRLLAAEALASDQIGIDETTVQVLKESGRDPTTKSYMWVLRTLGKSPPIVLFRYRRSRSADFLKRILKEYSGSVMTDGYASYDAHFKNLPLTHVACWAHARRKFDEAYKTSASKKKSKIMIEMIAKLYKVEKEIRENNLSPEDALSLRKKKSAPIITRIRQFLDQHIPKTAPKSAFGKALFYMNGQWPKLTKFLIEAKIPIDNNSVENAIRPFVIGRKNWLFSGHPKGAQGSATLYTFIETAKANGLEPHAYLQHLFENILAAKNDDDLRKLLPTRMTPDNLGAVG